MSKIILSNPLDRDYVNPSAEIVKETVFERSDEIWKAGYPEILIDFFENGSDDEKSFMIINGHEKFGFRIEHKYNDIKEKTLTLTFGEHNGETIESMNPAGESANYFREYFVPKEIAWQAIEYFLKNGERDSQLNWEKAQYPKQSWED